MNEENVRVVEPVKELVYVADRIDEWLSEHGESNDIINYLHNDQYICM